MNSVYIRLVVLPYEPLGLLLHCYEHRVGAASEGHAVYMKINLVSEINTYCRGLLPLFRVMKEKKEALCSDDQMFLHY